MRKLLLAAATVLGLCGPGNAAVVGSFGLNPTSASGAFQHSLGSLSGFFDDQWLFSLSNTLNLTIGSVTNVFAQPSDKITAFTGSVVFLGADGVIGGGDDSTVIGPLLAGACPALPTSICQGFAGSAILGPGNYMLELQGIANGTSGYGGNLATFAVAETPLPAAVWLFGGGIAGLGALLRRRKKQAQEMVAVPA